MSVADYGNYEEWKAWNDNDFFRASQFLSHCLDADFEGINLKGRTFLEIGFGNGQMLSWAKRKGASIYGIEILERSIKLAKENQIAVIPSLDRKNVNSFLEYFDVIAAYDVFEHLTIKELAELLEAAACMLKPGGKLVARFPNGQSPFGLMLLNADHTHRSALSAPIMSQLVEGSNLAIVKATGGAWRPYGPISRRIGQYGKFLLRRMTEWYLRRIFDLDCELGNNLVVTLAKKDISNP